MPTAAPDQTMTVSAALKRVSTIATLPETTAKIIAMVENPSSTAATLHKVISHDPALVARILKVVNSAFYGLPGQVNSIERAIVLLGLNAVKNIAVAASIGQLFRGAKLCEAYTAKDLWTHCVGVAVAGRELCKRSGLKTGDEAFLAGMIHDVGLLVTLQLFPEQLRTVCEESMRGGSFVEHEQRILKLTHQKLGAGLAQLWRFPKTCQLVTEFHHDPSRVTMDDRAIVTVVCLADTICAKASIGFPLTASSQSLEAISLEGSGIKPEAIAATQAALPQLMEQASAFL